MDTISKDEKRPGERPVLLGLCSGARRAWLHHLRTAKSHTAGQDRFRALQARKSNPLKRSLFSYIIPQHQRTIDFLKTLPNVDPKRIGFYGLLRRQDSGPRSPHAQGLLSLDLLGRLQRVGRQEYNRVDSGTSYMFTGEYEIFEWNMGHVANYAELASLMTPRPFMVERGHFDGVAPDEWVG